MRITAAHEAQEFDLLVGVGSEIGVATFGRNDAITLPVPDEEGLAETGARSEQGPGATGLRFAWIQNAEVFRGKVLDAVAGSTEVIHEHDLGNIQLRGESAGVYGPGKIGGANSVVNDRASDAEAGGANRGAIEVRLSEPSEFLDNEIKGCKTLAGEALAENGREGTVLFRE